MEMLLRISAIALLAGVVYGQTPSSGPVVLDTFQALRTNDLGGAPPPPDYNHLWFAGGEHAGQTCDTMGGISSGTMLIHAPSSGSCSGQMVDGKVGPGMANVFWFPANDGGWQYTSPCTRANGCQYTQSYTQTVPVGTAWTTLNRLYFTMTSDNTIPLYRNFTDGTLQIGYYIRSHDNSASQNQGAHYYNYVDTGIYAGHKLYYVMNRKPQHNNESATGFDLWPEDPEWNDCCNGQGNVSPVHWWDGETVFYVAAGVNLGGWTGNFTFTPFTLGVEAYREPDDFVSSITGTYVGAGQESGFGGTYEVTWEDNRVIPGGTNYHIYYNSSCSMHVCGISSGTSGGTARGQAGDSTDASPYGVTWWNSPAIAEATNMWVAIRPDMNIWAVTSTSPITVQTRTPYDRHWLQTGDQVTIANLCAAANGTRTVTVVDNFTVSLGVSGSCSYAGYASSSSATMTATSDTQNFTEILIGPGASGPNPSLVTYTANFLTAMQTVQNSIAVKPQPRVLTTAQHIPSNLNWVNSGQGSCDPAANTCPFNSTTKFNAFTDGMETNGASGLDLNIDLVVMSAASQYTGSIATDCPSGWRCKSLANLDALIAHAAGDGLTVKLRPSMGNVVTPCGLTSSSNEAAVEACIKPLEVAAALRWPTTVQRISILHEAVGAFGTEMPMPLTVPFVHTLLVNTAAALHTANASLKVGAAAETMFAADAAYFNDYLTISGLNYIGVDLYGSSCDVSQYPTTAVSTLASWGASIATAGKQGDIEEAAAPRWLPLTCTNPGEQFAYEGSGDSDFLATQPIWLDVITRAAGAYGYRSFSLFPSPPLLWTTSDAPNSFMTSGTYVADMMAHLTESTLTGARYARTQGWYSGSIQGKAATAGRITLIADAGCNSVANDTSVHIATFYNGVRTFSPPTSPGAIYADAQYNCPVTRLSNGFTQFNKSIGPEYSSPSAMNQNDTLVMLGTSDGFYAAFDKFGHVVVPFANLHIAGTPGPRWMYGDPYSFVYLKSGGTKNVLAKGTIPTNYNGCRPTCTVTETILHTFSEYSILDIGGGEGDLQNDNFIALNGTLVSDSTNEVFVYDMANDVKHTPLNYGSSANFNNAEPMPTTDVAVCLTAGPVISGVVYPGKFLFDNDMTFIRKLSTGCDHDTFFAYNGHRWHASTDGMAQFCSQAGFYTEDIDIGTSSAVCHHNGQFPHGTSTHMGSAKDGSGWVSISLVDYSTVSNSASYSLNGIWNQGCGPNNVVGGGFGFWCSYQNEIMAYDFAHDKLYRVAQHRSCPQSATQQSYSKIPKASMARDGAYIAYSSDMCLGYNAPLNDYRDGWMVDVTSIRNR